MDSFAVTYILLTSGLLTNPSSTRAKNAYLAGFLSGGYSIPLYCITRWTRTEPLSLCKLCAFLDNSLATVTVWTLALTSLDRYYMVVNYKR